MPGPYKPARKSLVGAAYMPLARPLQQKSLATHQHAARLFLFLLPFQPEHLEFAVPIRLVRVKFLGQHVPFAGIIEL